LKGQDIADAEGTNPRGDRPAPAEVAARHKQERDVYAATLQRTRTLAIDNLTERFAQKLRDRATSNAEELERYLRERGAARQLQAEIEQRQRELEEERTSRVRKK
jgi:2-oxoglutarate dehydrogenase complex dehydrogenase (E1) component-like enzyme